MAIYNVHQAKTQLSKLLDQAEAGEEVVIARSGKPIVRLTPIRERRPRSELFGILKGKLVLDPDWDSDEVNEEIARDFEESVIWGIETDPDEGK